MEVVKVESLYQHALCVYLRTVIFIQGQNVPIKSDIELNEDEATYFLAIANDNPVATARYRIVDDKVKVERVGVLDDCRGKGYGQKIMQHLISEVKQSHPDKAIKLSSQDNAIPFYEGIGFTVEGDGFMDANIPHHMMVLKDSE